MAFQKKTWLARLGQGLNKFIFNGGSKVTLDSSPDVVTQEGTPLSAENMNDLEDRIDDAITSLSGGYYSHSWTFESFVSAGDGRIFVYGGHMVIASVLAEFSTTVSTGTVFATLPSAIKPSTNIASLFCFNYNTSNDTVATMRGTACTLNTSGQVSQSIGNIGTQRRLLAFFVWFI